MIPVIGIAGKMGTGKTTTANLLANRCRGVILNFAGALKKEAAERYNFDIARTFSQEGKESVIFHPDLPTGAMSVREILQYYGHKKRQEDPGYWDTKVAIEILAAIKGGGTMILIDDVRHPSECKMLREMFGGYVFRLEPHEQWVPSAHARHYSEIALDDYTEWDGVFHPRYGELDRVATTILFEMQRRKMI